ncbi:hypothetical protein M569_14712, partial [Genlisea aurea]
MPIGCYIRALWVFNSQDSIVFSRKFPLVEHMWRRSCDNQTDSVSYKPLPSDSKLAAAFVELRNREGSARGYGLRLPQSAKGSDSWVDDPITRHIISLPFNGEEEGDNYILWPLVFHTKGSYTVLVLPLVELHHLEAYRRMCNRPDCGGPSSQDENLSSLLLGLPSITGAVAVAVTVGDVVLGDSSEPEIVVSTSTTVGGLLDSLTGGIGISSRTKPVAAPASASTSSGSAVRAAVISDSIKTGSKLVDKDLLTSFIRSALPFGAPLDLSYSNFSAIRATGFSPADIPPVDRKQPAWKPFLYKGKQRILFTIQERVHAALYDRDDIPDRITISGQVNCRAELEGLPDVSLPLIGLKKACADSLSFHSCAQFPEHGDDKQMITFSPPSGNFVLLWYQASCSLGPPVKGFYQLSMVSENEGAFLFKLSLVEGYKSSLSIDFCTITMPFPKRKVVSLEGTPSVGTVSNTDHSVEWRMITNPRSVSGKSIEATFSGTVRFEPWKALKLPPLPRSEFGVMVDEDSDPETDPTGDGVSVEDYTTEKSNRDLQPVALEEPFSWQAYNFAKVSFKITGGSSLSGISVDSKSVNVFPSVKAPVEVSSLVTSGDYILWNTLGRCPVAAS